MLSFLIQNEINRVVTPTPGRAAALKRGRPLGPKSRRDKADARYIKMLENGPLLTGTIASRLGISHMGCLSSLYSLEERKIVRRLKANTVGLSKHPKPLAWELL